MRKKIVILENQLSTYINKSNMKRGGEEAMLSRLRTLLEKSEAARHQAEYNLVLEKKTNRELEEKFGERENGMSEEINKYKGEELFLNYKLTIKLFSNPMLSRCFS